MPIQERPTAPGLESVAPRGLPAVRAAAAASGGAVARGPTWISLSPKWVYKHSSGARLGGCRRPGLLAWVEDDLASLRRNGVDLLVTLEAEHVVDTARVVAAGLSHSVVPFVDMAPPSAHAMIDLCLELDVALGGGAAVCVHCKAGLGRTGTVLAAYLVWKGQPLRDAIATIRQQERRFISSARQEQFLEAFEEAVLG